MSFAHKSPHLTSFALCQKWFALRSALFAFLSAPLAILSVLFAYSSPNLWGFITILCLMFNNPFSHTCSLWWNANTCLENSLNNPFNDSCSLRWGSFARFNWASLGSNLSAFRAFRAMSALVKGASSKYPTWPLDVSEQQVIVWWLPQLNIFG